MSGISSASGQHAAVLALYDAAKTALQSERVDVCFGRRGQFLEQSYFLVTLEVESNVDMATIGPQRSQNEDITMHVEIAAEHNGGDDEAIRVTFKRAHDILSLVQEHIRKNDITLSDTVLWCLPARSVTESQADQDAGGAVTVIVAEFSARHRIRTTQ